MYTFVAVALLSTELLFSAGAKDDTIPYSCYDSFKNSFWCNASNSIDDRINTLIKELTLDEKALLLTARESPLNFIPRLGIAEYDWGTNCVYAAKTNCGSKCASVFPMTPNLAATFNTTLIRDVASVVGRELRSLWLQGEGESHTSNLPHAGLDCWGPTINIARDPRWGRNYETPGEDPYVNGIYGTYFTLGLQNGSTTYNSEYFDSRFYQTVATLKHYAAYSLEGLSSTAAINRHTFDAKVSRYMLNDTYLPAWQASIQTGGAQGVMCSYNAVNGVPSCANTYLLKDVLRENWGYQGYVTSDSGAISNIYETHHYTSTLSAAVASAINASCDLNSGGGIYALGADYGTDSPYQDNIASLVKNGTVSEDTLDAAMYHLFRVRFVLGLFDPIDDQKYWQVPADIVNNDEAQQLNAFASKQSIILLKNGDDPVATQEDDVLPYNLSDLARKKIAVIGPHFNATQFLLYSGYTPPVCMDETYDCVPGMLQVLNERVQQIGSGAEANVKFAQGCDVLCNNTDGFAQALQVANDSDYIVLMMGLDTTHIEREGQDRSNISLPGMQQDLASAICALGSEKKVVLVLLNGGMVGIDGLKDECDAIIEAHYPGFYGASAIWDVIFGDYNPSGKLVMTMYYSNFTQISNMTQMNIDVMPGKTYKYFNQTVIYPFGYGLSYTVFELNAQPEVWHIPAHAHASEGSVKEVDISVKVSNNGPMQGCETIFVMLKPLGIDANQSAAAIQRKVIDFYKVDLEPNTSQVIEKTVTSDDLMLVDNDGIETVFDGEYQLIFTNGVEQSVVYNVTVGDKLILSVGRM